jgi:tellurite resistance protein TerC
VGLSAVLVFVGVKMLLSDLYPVPIGISLAVIVAVLACAVAASLMWPRHDAEAPAHRLAGAGERKR